MARRLVYLIGIAGLVLATTSISFAGAGPMQGGGGGSTYDPVLDPAHFVSVIDNPYFPLPVARTLVYKGVRDGQSQIDTVTVTDQTRVIQGITATVVNDVATHHGKLLEKTTDWYAQDDQGNVWYLGERTKAYLPNGQVDTSGSWEAGVDGAKPGIIMEADPQVPDGYRQEFYAGQAEDTAWVIDRGGSVTVPLGTVQNVLRTLEFSRLEPKVVDQKIYAPGYGIVLEQTLAGGQETAELVSVTG